MSRALGVPYYEYVQPASPRKRGNSTVMTNMNADGAADPSAERDFHRFEVAIGHGTSPRDLQN